MKKGYQIYEELKNLQNGLEQTEKAMRELVGKNMGGTYAYSILRETKSKIEQDLYIQMHKEWTEK